MLWQLAAPGSYCYARCMIIGVDEVGRGCWAGPVVAGAVLLDTPIPGLKDSKKLSKKQRELLATAIRMQATAYGLGWVPADEVDRVGLTQAVRLAMQRAVGVIESIGAAYEQIIIDGNYNYLDTNQRSSFLIKADDLVPAVSAASIIAKVARDDYMAAASIACPGYAFERHVGYGTAAHSAALKLLGVCELHRTSFAPIKALLQT
jgi:ribonuclease HII